jgi:hypothetical protein
MSAGGSPSDEAFSDVVRDAVTAVLKPAGFRKSGANYHRRRGSCVQVVNVQTSRGSSWDEKRFFINVGLAFDELCALTSVPVLEKPKEYECDECGTRDRLEMLVANADEEWCAGPSVDAAEVTMRLRCAVTELVGELDRIDGPAQYRGHRWFDRFRPKQENAQVLYVLGDHAAAIEEVQRLAKLFHDRQNANRAEWWIERLGLKELESQRAGGPAAG